jgi:hypothetical protein
MLVDQQADATTSLKKQWDPELGKRRTSRAARYPTLGQALPTLPNRCIRPAPSTSLATATVYRPLGFLLFAGITTFMR